MINWKVRLRNKTFLMLFIPYLISVIYQILSLFGFLPKITENEILEIVTQIINILGLLGIVVDGTTKGISDSERAMKYEIPQ
jgi:phi LC3 family holin